MNEGNIADLPSISDRQKFERLASDYESVDGKVFLERSLKQLSPRDREAAYAFFLEFYDRLNLESLRSLFHYFKGCNSLEMALPVVRLIHSITELKSDYLAERKVEIELANQRVEQLRSQPKRNPNAENFVVSEALAERWTRQLVGAGPYDSAGEWLDARRQTAEDVIRRGWKYYEFDHVSIGPDIDWSDLPFENRSWLFHLQAWEFLDAVLLQYLKRRNSYLLEWAITTANSWIAQVVDRGIDSPMAWYDMAIALRSMRLAALLRISVAAGITSRRLVPLYKLVLAQLDALKSDEAFNPRNNHGFYTALGQLVLAKALWPVSGADDAQNQGKARMDLMAKQQFHADGGHAEHSPDYHRMLLNSFQEAISQGLLDDEALTLRIARAAEALGWFIQPTGKMLQFGDSPARDMQRSRSSTLDVHTQFIQTDGKHGKPNPQELYTLPMTGYAMVRTPQPQASGELRQTSYLALMAGFHSRAHKHCDDLSVVWAHKGQELLVDGGRYGYGPQLPADSPLRADGFYYADLERQYVESVRAHNTVSIDGQEPNRRRRPYGSGLVDAYQTGNVFHIEAEAPHDGWHHRRTVEMNSEVGLTLTDVLSPKDEREHTYQVYFLLDGALKFLGESECGLRFAGNDGLELNVTWSDHESRITTAYADASPLRGWRSTADRHLEPAWSIARSGYLVGPTRLTTRFEVVD